MGHFAIMLAVREGLAEQESDVPHRRIELVDAHNWIGKAARKAHQLERAIHHHKMARSILSALLASDPGMVDYVIRLSNAELILAIDYMYTGDANQIALETLARARNRLTELTVESPGLKKRIIDNLASIDANIATLNRRLHP